MGTSRHPHGDALAYGLTYLLAFLYSSMNEPNIPLVLPSCLPTTLAASRPWPPLCGATFLAGAFLALVAGFSAGADPPLAALPAGR